MYGVEWKGTHSGAIPKSRDVSNRDMTPQKKVSFSRSRTTLEVCQVAASLVTLADTLHKEAEEEVDVYGEGELTLALNFCISISNCCVVCIEARRLNKSFLKTSLMVSSARILSFSLRFASWRWNRSSRESKYVSIVSMRRNGHLERVLWLCSLPLT